MKTLIILLWFTTLAHAETPRFVFENRPESGIPREAQQQVREEFNPLPQGTLAKKVEESIDTVTVRYFLDTWSDKEQVEDYLTGLLTDDRTEVYDFQIWSQIVGEPEIECLLNFKNHAQGRLLVWGGVACVRDDAGKWWFVTTFDYYHGKHPKGDRSLVRKVSK